MNMQHSSSVWKAVMAPLFVVVVAAHLVSCTGVPLVGAAMEIGRNLLSTAAANYAPAYSENLKTLINALGKTPAIKLTGAETGEATFVDEQAADGMADPATIEPDPLAPEGGENPARKGPVAIELDIAIMKEIEVDGRFMPIPIENGDMIRDGGGVENAGDNLKICFRTNTRCSVYVIGIDATGWVSILYPDEGFDMGNPVLPQKEYMIPGGNVWYYLDQYRGKETVYFVASHERRMDLEEILVKLDAQTRPEFRPDQEVKQVQEVAVVERLRGFAGKRPGRTALVPTSDSREQEVTPTQFYAKFVDADLVITRWFNHVGP